MDPLRQQKMQNIICKTWPTSQINDKDEYLLSNAMYQKVLLYYELLKPEFATRQEAVIFHHDNALPHVVRPFKNYLENSG